MVVRGLSARVKCNDGGYMIMEPPSSTTVFFTVRVAPSTGWQEAVHWDATAPTDS